MAVKAILTPIFTSGSTVSALMLVPNGVPSTTVCCASAPGPMFATSEAGIVGVQAKPAHQAGVPMMLCAK